ncbi:MAG TPA: peptidyl-prolyl cis-trans isomerase [Terriglobia bacterium]|nr:peptidyl-prolyl cis-trans isomerase [Terriglobia bacterium]
MPKKIALILSTLSLVALLPSPARSTTRIIERIIARVNNEIVTQRQFDQQQEKLRDDLAERYSGAELEAEYRKQSADLLRNLIDEDLMVQKAKDLDISVETDLIKRLDQIRAQNNLATLADLEKEVEKQGLIWEDFQDQIRRQMLMQKVIEREVGSRVQIARDEAQKYFEAHQKDFASPAGVRLAQIMISTDKHKPDEAKERAASALAELKNGAKWEDVVKKYSDDEHSAGSAGDIGFLKEGTMAPQIASAIAKLDTGDTSEVVQTKYGYMIFKVEERRSAGTPKFEEVEQRVDEVLYNQQIQTGLRDYLTRLRQESYIYLAPGYVDGGAAPPTDAAKRGE